MNAPWANGQPVEIYGINGKLGQISSDGVGGIINLPAQPTEFMLKIGGIWIDRRYKI